MSIMTSIINKFSKSIPNLEEKAGKALAAGKVNTAIKAYLDIAGKNYPRLTLDKKLDALTNAAIIAIENDQMNKAARILMKKSDLLRINARNADAFDELSNAISAAKSSNDGQLLKELEYEKQVLDSSMGKGLIISYPISKIAYK